MKNNGTTTTILNWGLAIAVVGVAIGALNNYFKTSEARMLQSKIANYQNNQAIMQNLMAETLQYSQRNPAIDPILEAIGAKPGKNAPTATAKPAAK